jgi:hypothetical protein
MLCTDSERLLYLHCNHSDYRTLTRKEVNDYEIANQRASGDNTATLRDRERERPDCVGEVFYPDAKWTWYGIEFDGEDIFFGYVVGHVAELGYFSLKELCATRAGTFHMPIERDISFTPCTLSALQRKVSD